MPARGKKRVPVNEWRRKGLGVWHAWTGKSDTCQCLRHTRTFDELGEPARSREGGWQSRKTPPPKNEKICQTCADAVGFKRRKARSPEEQAVELERDLSRAVNKVKRALRESAMLGHELAVQAQKVCDERLQCVREEECTPDAAVKCINCVVRIPTEAAIASYRTAIPKVKSAEPY